MKILIVEDEKLLADSLRAMLEGKGFAVEAVYDGETGAEYAETGVYDLLILDVMMPGLDGYQVARQVRARRCGTPILMLTARSSLEDRIEGLNAGADYYLTKPFDTRELLACIGALLRRHSSSVLSCRREMILLSAIKAHESSLSFDTRISSSPDGARSAICSLESPSKAPSCMISAPLKNASISGIRSLRGDWPMVNAPIFISHYHLSFFCRWRIEPYFCSISPNSSSS